MYSIHVNCGGMVIGLRASLRAILQVEKSFLQNEGGYRDGLELQKGKKQGVVTQ